MRGIIPVRSVMRRGLNLLQPWYLRRPRQMLRRTLHGCRTSLPAHQVVRLPWGATLRVDGRELIGRSILHVGAYDPCVCELLARLASKTLTSVDVGANIGCMTTVLARYSSLVLAFEPHPAVQRRLAANMRMLHGRRNFSPCTVYGIALSDREGDGWLRAPRGWDANQGLARVEEVRRGGALRVITARLDSVLGSTEVGVMKVDVEGHELNVFRGASRSLAAGRIRHVLYEDYVGPASAASRFLGAMGYVIFPILGARLSGPLIGVPGDECPVGVGVPNYIATRHPEECLARCRRRGWQTLPWSLE